VSEQTRARMGDPPTTTRLGLRAAPWLLWFGVLGGSVAWSLHTVIDWSLDETTCRAGHTAVNGIPLRPLLAGIAMFFVAICVLATVVAYRQWRRLDGAPADSEVQALAQRRAAFMAVIGFVANLIFLVMLICATVAILFFPACWS
jgi:hypothetical protein